MINMIIYNKSNGLSVETIGEVPLSSNVNDDMITSLAHALNFVLEQFDFHSEVPEFMKEVVYDNDEMKIIDYDNFEVCIPKKGSPYALMKDSDLSMMIIKGVYVNALVFKKKGFEQSLEAEIAELSYRDRPLDKKNCFLEDEYISELNLFKAKNNCDLLENFYHDLLVLTPRVYKKPD